MPEGRARGSSPPWRTHQRARLAASRMPIPETGVSDANEVSAEALRSNVSIKPMTPNAPTRGSLMISSLRSTEVLTSRPSQQSARPSRCKPPVKTTQITRVTTPATSGGKANSAPLHASHVIAPMTKPTNEYQIDARPLSPADQSSGSLTGRVVIKAKAMRRDRILFLVAYSCFTERCHLAQDAGRGVDQRKRQRRARSLAEAQIQIQQRAQV